MDYRPLNPKLCISHRIQHPTGGEAVLSCNKLRDSKEVRRGYGPVQHGAILVWEAFEDIWTDTAPG